MDKLAVHAFRFGTFRLDLVRHRLTGPDGADLNLAVRAYDVLVFLLQNRDRVVSKDELMKAVWPRSVVEENNLNQAITNLRRALGDRRDSPQFVRTISGRGYRFVGDVAEETAGQAPAAADPAAAQRIFDPRRRHLLVGLGLATVAAGGAAWFLRSRRSATPAAPLRSLAVLPFRPLVDGVGDAALEFGMADTLITRLSALPGLVVRPLSSVRPYGSAAQDPLQAGRNLDADAVLEGHVLVRADRVRLTARLLDVASGTALWSGSFEEPLEEFFAAQDAIADQVATAMQFSLTDREQLKLLDRPTNDVRAWQLYSNARYYFERKTPDGFRRALEYFKEAEELDPAFALAAVGQADSWAVLGVLGIVTPAEAFARAAVAAERALALAPGVPEGLAAMGHILVQGRRDWRGGERLYRRALEAKPRFAQCRMWLANNCAMQGRLREALVEARRAQELEPLSLTFAANVGMILYHLRDYSTALAQLRPLVEAAPEFQLARQHLARVLIARGSPHDALALLDSEESRAFTAWSNLGWAYAATGQRALATAEIQRFETKGARGFGVGYDLAVIHAALGDTGGALVAIERGARDGSQGIGFLNSEPGLDPIRNHPRFRAVSRGLGLG